MFPPLFFSAILCVLCVSAVSFILSLTMPYSGNFKYREFSKSRMIILRILCFVKAQAAKKNEPVNSEYV